MTNKHGADRPRRRMEWLGRAFALGMTVLLPAVMRAQSAPSGPRPSPARRSPGSPPATSSPCPPVLEWLLGRLRRRRLPRPVRRQPRSRPTRNFLYHNNRDGTFTLIDDANMPKIPSNQHGAGVGRLRQRRPPRPDRHGGESRQSRTTRSIATTATARFSAVTDGPIYTETYGRLPRGPAGAITTTTASSTCSSPATTSSIASSTTTATARSRGIEDSAVVLMIAA